MLSFLKSFGSGIHASFSVQSQPAFSDGCWTIYDGKSRSTKELVSVFVLDKRTLADGIGQRGIRPRTPAVNEVVEYATREAHKLTKLRHPALLRVVAPLETTSRTLTFVTERVSGTLGLLLRTSPEELDDLAVVRGSTLVVDALRFLHDELGLVHLNVTPDAILIDANGDWKLAGLGFAEQFSEFSPGQYFLPQCDPRMPSYMQPQLDYLPYEVVVEHQVGPPADVWALACVLYTVYHHKSPLVTRGNPDAYREEHSRFERNVRTGLLRKMPASLQPYIPALFSTQPDGRITLATLLTTDFFDNPLIKALHRMDEFATLDVNDQLGFLKHLTGNLLPQFPKTIKVRKILHFATTQLLDGPRQEATGALLGSVAFQAATDLSRLSFSESILPLFSALSDWLPFQEAVAENLPVIVRNTSDKDFSSRVVPVIVSTLKTNAGTAASAVAPVQVTLLNQSDEFVPSVTVSKLEQALFPAVVDLFASTPSKTVKIACIMSCCAMVRQNLSKTLIVDRLVPTLQAMKTREPAVVMAAAQLWAITAPRLGSALTVQTAVPHLLLLSMAKDLTVAQYTQLMAETRKLLDGVERERVQELRHNVATSDSDEWVSKPASTPATTLSAPTPAPIQAPAPAPAPAPVSAPAPAPVPAPVPSAVHVTSTPTSSHVAATPALSHMMSPSVPTLPTLTPALPNSTSGESNSTQKMANTTLQASRNSRTPGPSVSYGSNITSPKLPPLISAPLVPQPANSAQTHPKTGPAMPSLSPQVATPSLYTPNTPEAPTSPKTPKPLTANGATFESLL